MKSTRLATLCAALGLALFLNLNSQAAVYGDASNDTHTNGDANLDITSVEVTNNGVNLVIAVTTRGFATWTKYLIWIDTPTKANAAANSNGWGRPASMAAGEGADFFIGSWVDATPSNAQLWEFASAWNQHSTSPLTNLISGNTVTFTIPLSTLGLSAGNVIKFDVATSGGGADPGVDHASRSTQATTGWAAPSTGGPMLSYTIASLADSDSDGLTDTWENTYFENLDQTGSGDPDSDGLNNSGELTAGTNPTVADTDSDGLNDGAEVTTHTTNPTVADTDGDGVNDGAEIAAGTNPKKTNYTQITAAGSFQGWSPAPTNSPSNVMTKVTGDEFGWELNFRMSTATNHLGKFTTGSWGVNWGTSGTPGVLQLGGFGNDIPFNVTATGVYRFYFNTDTLAYSFTRAAAPATYAAWAAALGVTGAASDDDDTDGLLNQDEFTNNSDPLNSDTDGDSLLDNWEVTGFNTWNIQTNPATSDTDGDGLKDGWEIENRLDPTDNGSILSYVNNTTLTVSANPNGATGDPDGDGLTNLQEQAANSNPLAAGSGFASTYAKMVVAGSFVQTKPDGSWDQVGNNVNTMQLVSNFNWKLVVYVASPLPTYAQFKFTTGSWDTNFGDNIPLGPGGAADGIGDLNGNNINALPVFTAPGYYAITFNDFSKAYAIAALAPADSDTDGLPDEWEEFYGGLLDPKLTDLVPGTAYVVGSSTTAAQAYAAGTHPTRDTTAPTLQLAAGVDRVSWVEKNGTVTPLATDVTVSDAITTNIIPTLNIRVNGTDQQSVLTDADGFAVITYTATDAAGNAASLSRTVVIGNAEPGYRNVRFPAAMTVNTLSSDFAYGEIFVEGATAGSGAATGIRAWIGVNTNNTDPATWDNAVWSPANYVGEEGNNDNYQGQISGTGRTPGTAYYYATRFQMGTNNTNYHFGGIGTDGVGGTWGGTREVVVGGVTNTVTNGNGLLTVQSARTLTFAVNMNVQTNKSLFTPTNQGVEVRGSFTSPTWAGGQATLTDPDSDGIYTGSFTVAGDLGTAIQYKFYRTGAEGAGFEGLATDRSYTLGANGVNATIETAFFNNDDGIGPVITRTGDATINLTVGDSYTDAGATAADAIDGSVTVTPSGSVNTAVAGTYTITYNASDAAGNAATPVTRTVIVAAASGSTFAGWSGGAEITSTNVGKYAIGGASSLSAPEAEKPSSAVAGSNLVLTALVRTDDTNLTVSGQAVNNLRDFADSNAVTPVNGSTNGVSQTNVPAGFQRQAFSVPQNSDNRKFLRLKATLAP